MKSQLVHAKIIKPAVISIAVVSVVLVLANLNNAQTTQPASGSRQPIVTNQFTTTSSGALQARAPGNYIQQSIAIQEGSLEPFDGNIPDNTPWVRQTFDTLFLQFVGIIQQMVDSLNLLVGANPLSGLLTGGTGGSSLGNLLSNSLTTGQGTSVPVN